MDVAEDTKRQRDIADETEATEQPSWLMTLALTACFSAITGFMGGWAYLNANEYHKSYSSLFFQFSNKPKYVKQNFGRVCRGCGSLHMVRPCPCGYYWLRKQFEITTGRKYYRHSPEPVAVVTPIDPPLPELSDGDLSLLEPVEARIQ
ncbi:hypothetical protein [Calycomorphotria hydatis]|uniref:Uncharacterized protein n=1 Tax=Calycomorphotria hydatis TaxID=2528027 RepID=A0A517TDL9_9PLAN|nr:hypothetical protein [Calycomorphotria hydatis]QDT66466.1 hypothetical protein V22_37330 [Calycomorphotria hydatis]